MAAVLLDLKKDWRLGVLMTDRDLSDKKVAELLAELGRARHFKTVQRWRTSPTRPNMDVADFEALCEILGCSPEELWSK